MSESASEDTPGASDALFRYDSGDGHAVAVAQLAWRRRAFVEALALGAGLTATRLALGAAAATPPATDANKDSAMWSLLEAVQDHLLPSEAYAPGARDVDAVGYLRQALSRSEVEASQDRDFILAGAAWLGGRVAAEHGDQRFADLSEVERERTLRRMTRNRDGENWVNLVLYYVLEALLADPVYGGNLDAAGWQWLRYTAGFPRPEAGTRYYELAGR